MRALLGLALAGCAAEPAALQLGVGGSDQAPFTDVADGADALLHIGSQGGFHVWVQARVDGLGPGGVELDYLVQTADRGETVGAGRAPVVLGESGDGWYETERAVPGIVCPAPPGVDLIDREVELVLAGSDGDGGFAEDRRRLTLRCPSEPEQVRLTCLRVCAR